MKIFFLFLGLSNLRAETLNEALIPLSYKTPLGHSSVTKITAYPGKMKNFYSFKFSNNHLLYEWELTWPVEESAFKKHQKNVFAVIKLSYQNKPTPYGGEITNLSHCSKDFQPTVTQINEKGKQIFLMSSFVDQNFNHGICKEEFKKYINCTSYYYDKKRRTKMRLDIFAPLESNCTKPVSDFFSGLEKI